MTCRDRTNTRPRGTWIRILFFALALLPLTAVEAMADDCVADLGGVLDGFVDPIPPSQIQIDGNCTIRNFPATNPLRTNFSFFTQPGQNDERWLVIFDNVVHTGQMSCNAVLGHLIWFTNGSSTSIQDGCQNLLVDVEKIDKQNPDGQTTAAVGIPFTYSLTLPVLFDPGSGTVIDSGGSLSDLHGVTIWDDLNDTGADLTYLSHVAYWLDSGVPIPHTFSNVGGFLTFDDFPVVPAGEQFVIEITVVLDDSPANVSGTQFVNTAKWDLGRFIEGVFYEPLPGEWGVTPPMTIAAPELLVTKTGPGTMNLGQWGDFVIDFHNTGLADAWDVTIHDRFPNSPTGGMCDLAPELLGIQVFAADGFTPVSGQLDLGSDYSTSFSPAPQCRLEITMMTSEGVVRPNQRLIIRYRTQLDAGTQDGAALTNVAGAVQWFNGDSSHPDRVPSDRTLTDGSVGVPDHEDAHTVNVGLAGFSFEKTVANLNSGMDPATTAVPGDTLRYTLRFRSLAEPLTGFGFRDELDDLNLNPAFAPGTLALVTVPGGADVSLTNPTGGSSGTGLVDVRDLDLPPLGEVVLQFDVTLASTLADGTVVRNQSELLLEDETVFALSDDPNVNGTADPEVPGDEDPTEVTIESAPEFQIEKTSADRTDDPNLLLAGETLRYTITVKNVGTADAVDAMLRDAIPANTAYVPGSTTLNGSPLADVAGFSPLANGLLIHSPDDPTPGSMPADASANPGNVATVTFDVVVDPGVPDGTVISNQGFVNAPDSGIVDQPSDDPTTPVVNDPTLDVVGNLPLLYAEKRVELFDDLGTPGIVEPGDTLRYTITVQNSATIDATGVVLTDAVPAHTTYVADSTRLNGSPVGQPDGGLSPLASGIDISSADRTPPLPGPGNGVISPGNSATLQFDLIVNAGTPGGTVISNQATVTSAELPELLTDGDGDPRTGPEPTVVVVGNVEQLSISKQVVVVGGGPADPGAELEYTVRVLNVGFVPATRVVITDDLNASQPGQITYVSGTATMADSTAGVSFAGSTITADYAGAYGDLQPGEFVVLRFRALLDSGLVNGTLVTNTAEVRWDTPTRTASASASIVVPVIPGVSVLNGSVWHDADFDDTRDAGELGLEGWTVELRLDGLVRKSAVTDANGDYRITEVQPNDVVPGAYDLRFRAPGAGANTALLGLAASAFTNSMQRITDIIIPTSTSVQGLNLPIDPNGVVYDSVARTPVAGATLSLLNASTGLALPASCFEDPSQQEQVTLSNGYYKFGVTFGDPACPSGGDYVIDLVVPTGSIYVSGYSQIVPPTSDASTAPFSVPGCPGGPNDVITGTPQHCEVQLSPLAPATGDGTTHHVHLTLDNSQAPGSSQIFNNHIPIDPELDGSISISKTTPMLEVSRGQLVPYVITVNNTSGRLINDVTIVDRFPPGFSYVAGTALVDDVSAEPAIAGRELRWDGLVIAGTESRTVRLLLAVGGGVTEGEYVNRAQAVNGATGAAISGVSTATVRIIPDPTFDCTDVTGKVFNDINRNGLQDAGEDGLSGVRLVTPRGLRATTDQYGRYQITCAITPNESRGSNFVLKVDDRTLPSGFRLATDQLQIQRATRGKVLRVNFSASIYRVVGIDLSDAVFEPNSTSIRVQWLPRIDVLLEELRKAPAVLRLSYIADTEDASLVQRRVEAVQQQLTEAWDPANDRYLLTIEPEVFWRRGAPPERPDVGVLDIR